MSQHVCREKCRRVNGAIGLENLGSMASHMAVDFWRGSYSTPPQLHRSRTDDQDDLENTKKHLSMKKRKLAMRQLSLNLIWGRVRNSCDFCFLSQAQQKVVFWGKYEKSGLGAELTGRERAAGTLNSTPNYWS
uniref:Uncharacterized protein n=1 Tax=Romanomermis culicivorax TaxID=13658 RepID=A0A915KAW9_ROMCU